MPLTPGSTRGIISNNISEMVKAGRPPRVAVAAALHNAEARPRMNDAGLGSRRLPNPMHANDVGVKQRVRALPAAPIHPNDVGLGMRVGGPPVASSTRGMTWTELHSRRMEIGRRPRG
jgi:hypothetical protein